MAYYKSMFTINFESKRQVNLSASVFIEKILDPEVLEQYWNFNAQLSLDLKIIQVRVSMIKYFLQFKAFKLV